MGLVWVTGFLVAILNNVDIARELFTVLFSIAVPSQVSWFEVDRNPTNSKAVIGLVHLWSLLYEQEDYQSLAQSVVPLQSCPRGGPHFARHSGLHITRSRKGELSQNGDVYSSLIMTYTSYLDCLNVQFIFVQ